MAESQNRRQRSREEMESQQRKAFDRSMNQGLLESAQLQLEATLDVRDLLSEIRDSKTDIIGAVEKAIKDKKLVVTSGGKKV